MKSFIVSSFSSIVIILLTKSLAMAEKFMVQVEAPFEENLAKLAEYTATTADSLTKNGDLKGIGVSNIEGDAADAEKLKALSFVKYVEQNHEYNIMDGGGGGFGL
eukprot:CAMPEP_0197823448 /NCGR_PEP_ID=MMETSP1437-20131217/783_1 /TAXON_ID=49252 ORGANISM="Eucampia antarctica, Strain CCMP1452" /NCGR_SAMPLE_ID=MMETSP1437 /ASSEMBLY_ACC=CAM_ASM_001096 /LENGTH=104 /DNA_ID=CAMNT_0043422617 /DNA_START=35 /DNA_END=349 /DNA_ORIENTATION=-